MKTLLFFVTIALVTSHARAEDVAVPSPATHEADVAGEKPVPPPVQIAKEPMPGKTLTLEEAVNEAVHQSTLVLKARRDDDVSGTQVLQSYLQFLPNLTAQGGYNYTEGKTFLTPSVPTLVDGKSHGASYSVTTTLNLFNGFSDIASWRASHAREAAADKTLTRAKQQISLDVSQSYLQTVLDKKLVEIAEKNLKASQDRELLIEEQTKVGLKNKSDLFRQQAQTSSDESFLITQQNKRQDDLVMLLRKLRKDPREDYLLAPPPSFQQDHVTASEPMDQDRAIDQALNTRQDYDVSKLFAKAAHEDVTSVRSTYMPKLDLFASYLSSSRLFDYQTSGGQSLLGANQYPDLGNQLRDQASTVYGITLTWNIFDHYTNALNVDRAKANAYKADIDSDDYRRQVVGEVKQALSDYKASSKQLETSERGLTASKKAYEVAEGRYEVGSITFVDLAAAQTALVQAEANRAQALIAFELQKRVVDFAVGTTPVD